MARTQIDLTGYIDRLHGLDYQAVLSRLGYGSFVGAKHKFVFVETPKAACSTLKWIILQLEGKMVAVKQMGKESSQMMCIHYRNSHRIKSLVQLTQEQFDNILGNDGYVRFCVVRNPYARLVSAWADKIRLKEPGYAWTWRSINSYTGKDKSTCPTFADFVTWVTHKQDLQTCNHHWRPMTTLLLPNLIRYNHTIHTENLEQGLIKALGSFVDDAEIRQLLAKHRVNESLPVDWRGCYTEETAKLVAMTYQEDFDRYGYDLDSWRGSAQTPDNLELEIGLLRSQLEKYEQTALEVVRARNDVIFELLNRLNEEG